MRTLLACLLFFFVSATLAQEAEAPPILINKNFEGGSLGKVEKLSDTQFRLHVAGQYDERGRNRQASWYFFRMENVAGRDLVLTLTDLSGEYSDKPSSGNFHKTTHPVFSYDAKTWTYFPEMEWDDTGAVAPLFLLSRSQTGRCGRGDAGRYEDGKHLPAEGFANHWSNESNKAGGGSQ